MTQPLTDQRSHSDLIAELYDRHAAGLFAYCYDQLGDTGAAADAVVAVLTCVPAVRPRRAMLFALARREISRRDVVYFPPAVDSAVHPATALIERVVREIRPHQREVLLLSAVCRLTPDELAGVLDVAIDTAGQLILAARNRFTQSLATALYHARFAEYVPDRVAEVYGALEVAPIEDILARLPWRRPPGDLRARLLALLPALDPAGATSPKTRLPVKQLWPTTPAWPLPLADPDQTTNASLIPVVPPDPPVTGLGRPALGPAGTPVFPDPARPGAGGRPKHEATTEPIPRLQGSIMAAMAEARAFRPWSRRQPPPSAPAAPDQAAREQDALPSLAAPVPGDVLDPPTAPITPITSGIPGTTTDRTDKTAKSDKKDKTERAHAAETARAGERARRGEWARAGEKTRSLTDVPARAQTPPPSAAPPNAPAFPAEPNPRARRGSKAAPMPGTPTAGASGTNAPGSMGTPGTATPATGTPDMGTPDTRAPDTGTSSAATPGTGTPATDAPAPGTRGHGPAAPAKRKHFPLRASRSRRHEKPKPLKMGEHHFDWAWELSGLLIAIAIALIVFFSIPMIVTP